MKKMFKLSCRPLAITSYRAFLKNKKRFGTSPCLIFYMIFEEIYVLLYSIKWPNFAVGQPLLRY